MAYPPIPDNLMAKDVPNCKGCGDQLTTGYLSMLLDGKKMYEVIDFIQKSRELEKQNDKCTYKASGDEVKVYRGVDL
jgi:hypothetical protein